jgi:hypothetical protein
MVEEVLRDPVSALDALFPDDEDAKEDDEIRDSSDAGEVPTEGEEDAD